MHRLVQRSDQLYENASPGKILKMDPDLRSRRQDPTYPHTNTKFTGRYLYESSSENTPPPSLKQIHFQLRIPRVGGVYRSDFYFAFQPRLHKRGGVLLHLKHNATLNFKDRKQSRIYKSREIRRYCSVKISTNAYVNKLKLHANL